MKKKQQSESISKELFFNNIAHEFRTPLSLILSPAEQLINEIDNPVHLQKLKMINRNALYLKQLIDQLLSLAKIEDGHNKVNLHKINLHQFFYELVGSFKALAEIRTVNFNYDLVDLNQEYWMDMLKVKIVISNLISNAIKFTSDNGDVDVRIVVQANKLKFRVTDTGIGIADSKIPHVFDRYYQEDRHVKHYIGTGIGLALCKELANQLKADLWVESEAGEGSTFYLELDVFSQNKEVKKVHDNAIFIHSEKTEVPEVDIVTTATTSKTYEIDENTETPIILLVEDNVEIRTMLKESIKDYIVIEASNGQEGVELALKYIPRIIITDLMMPDMDGFELLEVLRGDFKTNHIPVVVASALNEVQHRLDAFKRGASAFIPKPFNLKEVRMQIDNLLQLQSKEEENRANTILPFDEELTKKDQKFIQLLNKTITENLDQEHFGVESLSQEIGVSRVQLHRKITAICGCSASTYVKRFKMAIASNWLTNTKATVSEISFKLGFVSVAHFSRSFKEVFEYSPSKYKSLSKNK